jgi:hypothetical protein
MSGAMPPLHNTPEWRGAQLKHRDNFTFTFLPYRSCNVPYCVNYEQEKMKEAVVTCFRIFYHHFPGESEESEESPERTQSE